MTITHVTPREMELQAEVTRLEAEELKLHASLAESVLHAQAGWARYENANNLVKGYQAELEMAKAASEAKGEIARQALEERAALEEPSRTGGWTSLDGCR